MHLKKIMSNRDRPASLRGLKHLGSIARGAFKYGPRDPLFGHAMTSWSSQGNRYLPSSRTSPVYVVKAVTPIRRRGGVRFSDPSGPRVASGATHVPTKYHGTRKSVTRVMADAAALKKHANILGAKRSRGDRAISVTPVQELRDRAMFDEAMHLGL